MKLNLGCGKQILDGWVNVDKVSNDDRVEYCDLEYTLPYEENTFEEIRAHHVLEHIRNLEELMEDLHYVCKADATIDIVVPLANTLWDVADPTHVRRFNHRTFEYYCEGFSTSYDRPAHFILVNQSIVSEVSEWFDGHEWKVANLHVILKVIK